MLRLASELKVEHQSASSVGAESVLRGLRPLPPFPVIRVARPEQSHKGRYVIARKGTGTSRCCPDSSRADLCSSQVASHAIGRSGSSQAAPSQDGFASALQAACPFGPSLARTHLVPLEPLPFAPLMSCRILAHASRASWSKRKNSPVGRFGCDPFLAEGVFSRDGDAAEREARSTMPTTSTTFGASERASLVAGWIKKRAQATRPSSRLLPARDEVIYIFRTASAQAHRMPQTSSIWDKTHGCTMVSVSQALRRRSVEIRTAARPSSFPSLPPSRKRQTRHSGSRSAPLVFIPTPSPPPTAACRLDTCKDGSSTCEGRFRAAISLRRTAQWKLPILAGGEVIQSIASLSREAGISLRVNNDKEREKRIGLLSLS